MLEKSGAWIGYGGERLGNGREAAKQYLLEHQDLLKEIRAKLLAHAGIGGAAGATGATPGSPTAQSAVATTPPPAQSATEGAKPIRKVA